MIDMGDRTVYTRAYDPAQRIIAEAIRRKKDILAQIQDYRFDAYTKLIVHDATKSDTNNIFLITETQSTSFWEQPDKYKEVITSRKQSANIAAEDNLVSVGHMLNFNRNRILLGEYSIVSPTAKDAMEHYNYYLLDTVYIDDRPIFILGIEPKNEYDPLFVGEIQIVDSTYDVVGVDVGFSKGISFPFYEKVRYYQNLAPIEEQYWLPIEIGLTGTVVFPIPIPRIPSKLDFEHVASICGYHIDTGHDDGTFGEYNIEVDEKADDIDSATWFARQTIPLTDLELQGYERIDSLENLPASISKRLLQGVAVAAYLLTVGEPDIFHFNRVEGPYLGFGTELDRLVPNTSLRLKTGYGFDEKNWQHEFGFRYRLSERYKLWIGAKWQDEIIHRPTIISGPRYNPSFYALLVKLDPFDYYREKGYEVSFSVKPISHTRLRVAYNDYTQLSRPKSTDFGFLGKSTDPRDNPPIIDGKLRVMKVSLRYDSRQLIKNKGRDLIYSSIQYIRIDAGMEYASPDFIDNDFDFRRYYLSIYRRQRTFGTGITSIFAYAGKSEGTLPPQKHFIVDYHDPEFYTGRTFNTLDECNFEGNRVAVIRANHDFGPYMMRWTGEGFFGKIPFGLSLHGGVFWTDFKDHPFETDNGFSRIAPKAYSEAGFGFNNLTPFLMPFNLAIYFSWQFSAYDTEHFNWRISFKL
jgi:hypothetical protein